MMIEVATGIVVSINVFQKPLQGHHVVSRSHKVAIMSKSPVDDARYVAL